MLTNTSLKKVFTEEGWVWIGKEYIYNPSSIRYCRIYRHIKDSLFNIVDFKSKEAAETFIALNKLPSQYQPALLDDLSNLWTIMKK